MAKIMVGVLAAECCITNEPKLSGIKQPPFVMFPDSMGLEVVQSTEGLGSHLERLQWLG